MADNTTNEETKTPEEVGQEIGAGEGPTTEVHTDPEAPGSLDSETPATEATDPTEEAATAPVGGEADPASVTDAPNDVGTALDANAEPEAAQVPDQAALQFDGTSKPSDAEPAEGGDESYKEKPPTEDDNGEPANPVTDGQTVPTDLPPVHPITQEPLEGDGLGEDEGKTGEQATDEKPPVDLPAQTPSVSPQELPGAPNSGTPISVPETSVDITEGVPVKQDVPPVHPCTFQPLVNDGLGEDTGKVGELPKQENGGATPDAGKDEAVNKGGEATPAAVAGGSDNNGSKHLENKIAQVLERIKHLEHMLKRIIGGLFD